MIKYVLQNYLIIFVNIVFIVTLIQNIHALKDVIVLQQKLFSYKSTYINKNSHLKQILTWSKNEENKKWFIYLNESSVLYKKICISEHLFKILIVLNWRIH